MSVHRSVASLFLVFVAIVPGLPADAGSLPKEAIDAEIRTHLTEIQACYQRELNRQPSLEGEVAVKFEIAPDGTVATVEVARTDMDQTSVPSCVCEVVGALEFPAPAGGGVVRVTYPFRFRSVAGHTAPGGEGDDPVGPPLPPEPMAAPPSDDLHPRTVQRLRRASLALAKGRPERAETLFHRAWARDPYCGECARGLASALMAQDRHDAALRVLTERIIWFQHDARTWALRASCAYTIDEHEEARTSLDVYFDLVAGMPVPPAPADDADVGDVLDEIAWCAAMQGAAGLYTDYLLDDGRSRDAVNAVALVREHCGPDPGLDALEDVDRQANALDRTGGSEGAEDAETAAIRWTLPAPEGGFLQVETGAMHSCGLLIDGTVVCWGCGTYGEGGVLSADRGQCAAPEGRFADISAGQDHTCGLREDGSITCWGCGEPGGQTGPGFSLSKGPDRRPCRSSTQGARKSRRELRPLRPWRAR